MKTPPKYKVCRRLGTSVFTKCQTQKYALSEERRKPSFKRGSRSNYATQLIEKQRARFTYGVSEKQFRKFVRDAIAESGSPADNLYQRLEMRLDNVVFRLGYAKSRSMARQLVSHGHFKVNGKKLTVPSHKVSAGDQVELKTRSQDSLFASKEDSAVQLPVWLEVDKKSAHKATVLDLPKYDSTEQPFDLTKVVEFYSR